MTHYLPFSGSINGISLGYHSERHARNESFDCL